jgi:hypothetical protein
MRVPTGYLEWLIRECKNLDPDLEFAVRVELKKRQDPEQWRTRILEHVASQADAYSLEEIQSGLFHRLLAFEKSGSIPLGPELDELWILVGLVLQKARGDGDNGSNPGRQQQDRLDPSAVARVLASKN